MAITFPSAPTADQEFTSGALTWIWKDNQRWDRKFASPLTLDSISPEFMPVDVYGVRVQLYGTGFTANTQVIWNGAVWGYVNFISDGQLEAWNLTMPAAPTTIPVTVREAGMTDPPSLPFEVIAQAALTIASIDPPTGVQGAPASVFRFIGTGYRPDSVCSVSNTTVPSVYLSPTELDVTIAPPAGMSSVTCKVQNGMTVSNLFELPLTSTSAVTLGRLEPTHLPLDGSVNHVPVHVYGSGFTNFSQMSCRIWGHGYDNPNQFIYQVYDQGHLEIRLTMQQMPHSKTYSLTVTQGAVTSNALSLTIDWN